MKDLVAADLLKLRRRRGLVLSALGLPLALGFVLLGLGLGGVDIDGGAVLLRDLVFAMGLLGTVLVVLVGARLGSEEHVAGTLRYQLLTGVPRTRLYVAKALAALVATLTVAAVAFGSALAVALVLPTDGQLAVDGEVVLEEAWNLVLPLVVSALIAFGVGALTRATGPAITVALFLNFLGLNLVLLLTLIDDSLRHLALSLGIDRLTTDDFASDDDRLSFGAAVAVVVAWPTAFLLAGWARLRRLEV